MDVTLTSTVARKLRDYRALQKLTSGKTMMVNTAINRLLEKVLSDMPETIDPANIIPQIQQLTAEVAVLKSDVADLRTVALGIRPAPTEKLDG